MVYFFHHILHNSCFSINFFGAHLDHIIIMVARKSPPQKKKEERCKQMFLFASLKIRMFYFYFHLLKPDKFVLILLHDKSEYFHCNCKHCSVSDWQNIIHQHLIQCGRHLIPCCHSVIETMA